MEEKNINELTDEALDAVTGGATCQYNEETGNYDVISSNGLCVGSYHTEEEALRMANSSTQTGRQGQSKFHMFDTSVAFNRGL